MAATNQSSVVTEKILRAFVNCSRKSYLLMFDRSLSHPSDFEVAMEHRKARVRRDYVGEATSNVDSISQLVVRPAQVSGSGAVIHSMSTDDAIFYSVNKATGSEIAIYEPAIFSVSTSLRQDDRAEIGFAGYVLSKIQGTEALTGKVILADGSQVTLRLKDGINRLLPKITLLEQWSKTQPEPPDVVLNKHCPYSEFQQACMSIAKQNDSISQLGRIGERELRRLEKKGIFTIKQLSFLYRPRKKNRRGKSSPAVHKYELQALALRTGNIFLQGDVVSIPGPRHSDVIAA